MFKLTSVRITGFWNSRVATSQFGDEVNIIIGKNGTGKTTFMNILHAVLAVDIDGLSDNAFQSVHIALSDGKRKRTIRADKQESENPFVYIEYHISNKRFVLPLVPDDIRSASPSMRRRSLEAVQEIRQELSGIVSVASLSVYRIGGDMDPDVRDRSPKRYTSTVDVRLSSLMQRLTQYQLELSNKARDISADLQKEVLGSLLYSDEKARNRGYDLDFDEAAERQSLISAYKQLGLSGNDIAKRIQEHISQVNKTVENLRKPNGKPGASDKNGRANVDLAALEAFKLTRTVVAMSLRAEENTEILFSQISLFLKTLTSFVTNKTFYFEGGELLVKTAHSVPLSKLSSGEKQLLILFIEALLQRQKPYIFLADEPELSLHISWQRNIIAAIQSLNPHAQIVVATHAPEIAGRFKNSILNMEAILDEGA